MTTYPHVEHYHEDLRQLIEFGGSDNEQSIRRAFESCLTAYCREHKERVALVPELPLPSGVRPDGTVKDSLRMARGYWEAKDSHDNLDAEIQRKLNRGYPKDNIIFEDSKTAVLIQNGAEAMRVDMARPGEVDRLIRTFLDYELPQIQEFRQAQTQFKDDLPTVLENLRAIVAQAEADNPGYQQAATAFLDLCRQSIGPYVSRADVREMLLQHILTKDIFLRVFGETQFHSENNVAIRLEALEQTFFTGDVRRQAIDRLRAYYGAIGRAAYDIADHAEKQQFLKAVYEDFYKAYNPAAADRLGVVYTPNEVVDFIIRGADHLLQEHFGRRLADRKVEILDPATGTGTFVTNLIDYLAQSGEPDALQRLEYKYVHEIHANEVAILPYYIASLNIEYTYRERTGKYLEFLNLCFVDTLDNMDWQEYGATGAAVTRQPFLPGAISSENLKRLRSQNKRTISVIIGNPPYNANQQNENDNNKNRDYPEIDRRIRDTYIKASTAQKTKQYDMYKRFIRWASDRIADDGILAVITNRAYLDTRQDDGFRQVASKEFTDIYVLDLGSDVRRNPKISGTTHNVFGIQTGVAIAFFVREKERLGQCSIHYARREDAELAVDKLAYLRQGTLDNVPFESITPDAKFNWFNQSTSDFDWLLPLANKQTKLAKNPSEERAVFGLYSLGVVTNRDEWVYDFDMPALSRKITDFYDTYEETRREYGGTDVDSTLLGTTIKWTRDLKRHLRRNLKSTFNRTNIRTALFRPYVTKHLYFNQHLNEMQYRLPRLFPDGRVAENKVICLSGTSSAKPFQVLASSRVYCLDLLEKTQCLPLYRYTSDGKRVINITAWGLQQINDHYRKEWGKDFDKLSPDGAITAEQIFAYTYAVLHDPAYRHDYAIDLLREFPRLPLYHDFDTWARMGQQLLDLHIGFETAEPYALKRLNTAPKRARDSAPRTILRADKARGRIVLDDETTLTGVPPDAWRYRLGSRSALEWVLDQYKERTPRDPTIAEKFNTYRFADHKERVIDLLRRVCTVSVETMNIVDGMAYWEGEDLIVFGDRGKHEMAMLSLSQSADRPEDPEWEAAWSET